MPRGLCFLLTVIGASSAFKHTKVPSRRRALALGVTMVPSMARANDQGAARYASGYVKPKSKEELTQEAQAQFYGPFGNALAQKDQAILSNLYTSDATLIFASSKPFATLLGAAAIGPFVAESAPEAPLVTLTRCNGEVQYDGSETRILHTMYTCTANKGKERYTGYCRLVAADGVWKVDRQIFPLEVPKAYAMLQPKRDIFGNVYMQLAL